MRSRGDYLCILTINDLGNYGNRLQNYALQEVLKEYGPVTTVDLQVGNFKIHGRMRYIFKKAKQLTMNSIRYASGKSNHVKAIRNSRFSSFTRKYVPDNLLVDSTTRGLQAWRNIHVKKAVIGSDQVWNYTFGLSDKDLALRLGSDFAPEQLLTYAASIGLDSIADERKPVFERYLNRIPSISVREERAKELVEQNSAQHATVVLDPTLMVSAERWKRIMPGFVRDDDRYVLTYFLGTPSSEQKRTIDRYAEEHGLRVRRINDKSDPETFAAGPREFVELFSKAQYVFTDSYHACCFSIIFGKDFKVYNRNSSGVSNMNSRMQTLFNLFDLTTSMSDETEIPTYDHRKINERLAQLQHSSKQWLDNAIQR